jgi:hypothetical protein
MGSHAAGKRWLNPRNLDRMAPPRARISGGPVPQYPNPKPSLTGSDSGPKSDDRGEPNGAMRPEGTTITYVGGDTRR